MIVFTEDIMNPLFFFLENTRGVTQNDSHHPEGDVFNHSIQTLGWAFRESKDTDLILAAMLHDVGKSFDSHGHAKTGAEKLDQYISAKTKWLIENHMRFWDFVLGDMKKLSKVNYLSNHPLLSDLALLARWDKLGRRKNYVAIFDKSAIINRLNKCIPERYLI